MREDDSSSLIIEAANSVVSTPTPAASTSSRTVGCSQSECTISSPLLTRAPFMLPTIASAASIEAEMDIEVEMEAAP